MTTPSALPFSPASARRRLLDTGLALLEKQGVNNVSVANIAAAAGLPLADAYRYFGTKHDLEARAPTCWLARWPCAFKRWCGDPTHCLRVFPALLSMSKTIPSPFIANEYITDE
ncbi:TetR/AcrR family transcriptional regulator [Hymenobacter cavernae]|uniref:TetR/AcrR family transcriptional regulator n=1 Tax=Hymenobacter cavernae TaxID=2044852 RepID=UPI001664FDA9